MRLFLGIVIAFFFISLFLMPEGFACELTDNFREQGLADQETQYPLNDTDNHGYGHFCVCHANVILVSADNLSFDHWTLNLLQKEKDAVTKLSLNPLFRPPKAVA